MSKQSKKRSSEYGKILESRNSIYGKGTKPIIGVDIGSSYIKLVKMKKNNKIEKIAIEHIPEGLVVQGRIEAKEPLADLLKTIIKKYKIKGKDCAVCISGNENIVRELTIPEMDEAQIMENINHEIVSFLPLKMEDYSIDYKVMEYIKGENDALGKLRVLVAAIPNRLARAYVDTFKLAKLKVKYIDVIPNIDTKLARMIMYSSGRNESQDIAIMDFGAQTIDVSVLNQGNYCLHKAILNGGDYLTSIIAEKSGMEFEEAEKYKCFTNFFSANNDDPIVQGVHNYFDHLIKDIIRILEFYRNRNQHKGIDYIYIMGGGSFLKGLSTYLEKSLDVKVYPLSEALEMFRGGRNQTEYLADAFNAIGATMREEG